MRVELSVAAIAAVISYLRSKTDVNAVRGHSRPNLMPSFPTNYFLLILHYLFGCVSLKYLDTSSVYSSTRHYIYCTGISELKL